MITISSFYKNAPSAKAKTAAQRVAALIKADHYGFFSVLKDKTHQQALIDKANDLNARFTSFVILGTGGSSLGARTLCDIAQNPFSPKVHFLNNVDPRTISQLLDTLDIEKTCFIAISKSGSTAETLMQTLCLIKYLEDKGIDVKSHFHIITEAKASPLKTIAETYQIDSLVHKNDIGGRFSVFSNVGLLPAYLAGVKIQPLVQSALAYLDEFCYSADIHGATSGADAAINGMALGQTISVLMPYNDALQSFAAWYGQLWAESLGKNGQGTTPVAALGTVDQHSQLQLYCDGPNDKLYTILMPSACQEKDFIPNGYVFTDPNLAYMIDKSMQDLLKAEAKATVDSLINKDRPVRTIALDSHNEETMGQLLVQFMLETIIAAEMMGINAFDQPGVEDSKILTRDYMSSPNSLQKSS